MKSREERFKLVIERAIKGGWEESDFDSDFALYHNCPEILIFSHDFLKAYFGHQIVFRENGKVYDGRDKDLKPPLQNWQYHGCQLFLSIDRLKYLEEH